MTDPIHEQISAFIDGELSAAESELLLKRMQRQSELRRVVGRYALIGEALRGTTVGNEPRGVLSGDFAERVASAIAHEQAPARGGRWTEWLKPAIGGAIAAGVAAVALMSLRITPSEAPAVAVVTAPSRPPTATTRVMVVEPEVPPSDTVPQTNGHGVAPPIRVVTSGRLANFVIAHSEYSSPLGRRNVLTGLLSEDAAEPLDSINDADASAVSVPAAK